ncbi:MAG: hypothetical protein VX640_08715 [Pseudomonadota bacterium]|nr:hypothetical protein [Pseudomonadota bacterium]
MTIFLALFRFAVAVFAVLLVLAGLVLTPSPIPFGFVFIILGLVLLALVAPSAIRFLRRMKWFDRLMHGIEKLLPERLARQLRKSDVDHG